MRPGEPQTGDIYRPPRDQQPAPLRKGTKHWAVKALAISEISYGIGLVILGAAAAAKGPAGADSIMGVARLFGSSLFLVIPGILLLSKWKYGGWAQLLTALMLAVTLTGVMERISSAPERPPTAPVGVE